MRKIFVLVFLFIAIISNAQYPNNQSMGNDSALVTIKAATKSRLVNWSFTDTTAANLQRIKSYPGAQIFTTSDSNMWYRTPNANKWVQFFTNTATTTGDTLIWRVGGNALIPMQQQGIYTGLGSKDSTPLFFITNYQRRLVIPPNGVNRSAGTANKCLVIDTVTKFMYYTDCGSGGGTTYTSSNGITLTGSNFKLGGTLADATTTVDINGNILQVVDVGNSRFLMNPGTTSLYSPSEQSLLDLDDNTAKLTGKDSLVLSQTSGNIRMRNLNYTLSTTGKKIMLRDTASGLAQNIDPLLLAQEAANFADTTNFKPVVINTTGTAGTIGKIYKATYWPGGGSSSPVYSNNPADWLNSKSPGISPEFYTSNGGERPGSYYETSMYNPAPVLITAGTNKGKLFVATKGDAGRQIYGFISADNGVTWDTVGIIIPKAPTGWDKSGTTMPATVYDSATNTIHLWYAGYNDSIYPPTWGTGHATASGNSPQTFTKDAANPILTDTTFRTALGLAFNPIYTKISSVVKSPEDGKFYFHGAIWPCNVNYGNSVLDSSVMIWEGKGTTWNNPDSIRVIMRPPSPYKLVEHPSVFKAKDTTGYYMIYSQGYTDPLGGIDSAMVLKTAYSPTLKNSTFTPLSGTLLSPKYDSSWQGKRVYNASILKKGSGYYDEAIYMNPYDSTKGHPYNESESYFLLFYSASFPNSYHDQSSYVRLYPQTPKQTTSFGFNGKLPTIINRNTTTLINLPKADSSHSGYLDSTDYSNFYSKAPGSGSANYIQNRSTGLSPQASSSFTISDSAYIGKVLQVGGAGNLYALNVNANAGTGNYAGMQITNSANFGKDFRWQISTGGEIAHGGTGTSGAFTLSSFASGMMWQSTYWRWIEAQSPFNYIFEIDGTASANAVNIVPSAGKVAIGGYTKDSTLTNNGSLHQVGNAKFDAKIHAPNLAAGAGTKAVRWDATNGFVLADTTLGSGGSGGDSVVSFQKNAGRDSIILTMYDGRRFAAKDSVGTGGGGGWGTTGTVATLTGASTLSMGTNNFTFASTGQSVLLRVDATNDRVNINNSSIALGALTIGGNTWINGDYLGVNNGGNQANFGHSSLSFYNYAGTIILGNNAGVFEITPIAGQSVVINEPGYDSDFRVEGDNDANLIFADAGNDKVGIGTASPNSKFEVNGSFATKYTATATGITLDGTHSVVNVTATGQTITLPTAASITGRQYTIKLTASGSATVATTSSQTIDGSTTYSLASQYKYVTVVSDGSNWIVTANN